MNAIVAKIPDCLPVIISFTDSLYVPYTLINPFTSTLVITKSLSILSTISFSPTKKLDFSWVMINDG